MNAALQHAPRPLPLFLDMVRTVAQDDPELAARALAGLRRYASAPRGPVDAAPMAALGPLHVRAAGNEGPPVILIPSLINPAWVMDLTRGRSLLRWLGERGYRARLVDWGAPAPSDRDRDLAAYVETLLVPALRALGEPAHLVGYCLGGVLAAAAAARVPVRSLTLVATPWRFTGYPQDARDSLLALWAAQRTALHHLGLVPVELLQTAFWSLDPYRTVSKFAAIADLPLDDAQLATFVRLEDWANAGAPLSLAAGRDLFEGFIGDDLLGQGQWQIGGGPLQPERIMGPVQQLVARNDRIVPAATASAAFPISECPAGHVGMMVGSRAEQGCWTPIGRWLAQH